MTEKVKVHFYSEKINSPIKDEEITVDISLQDMMFATRQSAAVDIRSSKDVIIKSHSHEVISTGLYVSIPEGYCMKVYPRSGMSAKTSLIFKNTVGLIDSDYRGHEIKVMWYNLGNESIEIKVGDRIAQAFIEKVLPVEYIEVSSIQKLKDMGHDRGGGLGSTGR